MAEQRQQGVYGYVVEQNVTLRTEVFSNSMVNANMSLNRASMRCLKKASQLGATRQLLTFRLVGSGSAIVRIRRQGRGVYREDTRQRSIT